MLEELFPLLKDNEAPGPQLWNQMALFIRGLQSRSEPYLMLNKRPGGGLYFDLYVDQIRDAAKLSLWLSLDEEAATWKLSEGSIRIAPSTVVTVAAASGQVTDSTYVWIEWNATTATVQTGASLPNIVNMTNRVCRTPLGRIAVSDGSMTLTHFHPGGDIVVYDRPWILVDGYINGTKAFRAAGTNGEETYITPKPCPTSSDQSDSDSSSSEE